MEKLNGKWAFITGSSRGIGQQIAIGLAKRKVNIILHGRCLANLEATNKLVTNLGVNTRLVAGELNSAAGAENVVDQVIQTGCPVDILYNNAAIQNEWKEVWEITVEEWQELFQINLFSQVTIVNGLVPQMVKRGYGRVIITTSGIPDIPQLTPYGCSKAAVNKYVFDMSAQLKDSGVTINALDPGWLRTDLGGPNGEHAVESVLPGALIPVITDGVLQSGTVYHAQDYRGL